eukprot:CAMPEP_0171104742 /NCGR_PEP_ID=MMETSP0766_2-20121228/61239_1 /TAXON_ID=439317 /ORGANISM="Gambierdiscus australes, Strain CAWD 149" /LENGTH=306 /DNA_ID=CAMNT_0011565415 /DNA_START=210 /DNA_END=1130 /DNA_ORIENTATION=+
MLALAESANSSLLRQSAFLLTHDSATGFIGKDDIRAPFAQTQGVVLVDQLTCGARALDVRLVLEHDGRILYHHGRGLPSWVSEQSVDDTFPDLVKWSGTHASELILLSISHCYTRTVLDLRWKSLPCTDVRLTEGLWKHGVKVETDCAAINSWTLAEAQQHATMTNGGKMLAFPGEGSCEIANWDSSVTRRELVEPYVRRTMQESRTFGSLFAVQAFVQQTFEVPLADSASLNPQILAWIRPGDTLKGVNLLEINLICATGQAISAALGALVTESDRDSCSQACSQFCKKFGCSPNNVSSTVHILV